MVVKFVKLQNTKFVTLCRDGGRSENLGVGGSNNVYSLPSMVEIGITRLVYHGIN